MIREALSDGYCRNGCICMLFLFWGLLVYILVHVFHVETLLETPYHV